MKKNKSLLLSFVVIFVISLFFTSCNKNPDTIELNDDNSTVSQQSNVSDKSKDNDKKNEKSIENKKKESTNTSNHKNKELQKDLQKSNDKTVKSSNENDKQSSDKVNQNNPQKNNGNKPQQSSKPNNQGSQPTQPKPITPKPQNPTPQPTKPEPPKPQPVKQVYLTIECKTILNNMGNLVQGKENFVPKDGYILYKTAVNFKDGESVFDVLLRETRNRGIHMEYKYDPVFESHYIKGINQLYEFDCGPGSGWMYYVNGTKPNYGVNQYKLKQGDNIEIRYTCELGYDL